MKRIICIFALVVLLVCYVALPVSAYSTQGYYDVKKNIVTPIPLSYSYFVRRSDSGLQVDTYELFNQIDVGSPSSFLGSNRDISTGTTYQMVVARSYGNLMDVDGYDSHLQLLSDNFKSDYIYQCSMLAHSDLGNTCENMQLGFEGGFYTNVDYLKYLPTLYYYRDSSVRSFKVGEFNVNVLLPMTDGTVQEVTRSSNIYALRQAETEIGTYYLYSLGDIADILKAYDTLNASVDLEAPVYVKKLEFIPNMEISDIRGVGYAWYGAYLGMSTLNNPIANVHALNDQVNDIFYADLKPLGSGIKEGVQGFLDAEILPSIKVSYIVVLALSITFLVSLLRRL